MGITAHSTDMADSTGSAAVIEHRPRQEISCMLATRFMIFTDPFLCMYLVRVTGLEPASIAALEPKSSMFTNFIIPA